MNDRDNALRDALKKSEESRDNLFEIWDEGSWIIDVEQNEDLDEGEGKED
jgi:hypothetical protein